MFPTPAPATAAKHTGECAIEAARLARASGKPVKLMWTREEEFTWAYFRPAGVIDIRSGVSKDGLLTAWEYHNYNSGGSGIDTPYEGFPSISRFSFIPVSHLCGRDPTAGWRPPPIISHANRTWTNWLTPREWIRSNSATGT